MNIVKHLAAQPTRPPFRRFTAVPRRTERLADLIVSTQVQVSTRRRVCSKKMSAEQLRGNKVDLSEMALGEDDRVEWMDSNPSGLTWLKIDVPNASAEVVAALHRLVAKTTTLVELDAMERGAPNLNVLQLNGTEKVKVMDLSSKRLGPVSVAIIAACVQCNPVLESLKCAAARPRRVFAPMRPLSTHSALLVRRSNRLSSVCFCVSAH